MARQYRVSSMGSIMTPAGPNQRMLGPGTIVTDRDNLPIKEHVASGYLIPLGEVEVPGTIPGAVDFKPPPVETMIGKEGRVIEITSKANSGQDARAMQISEDEAAARQKAKDDAAAGKKGPDLSPWVLDPAELAKNDDLTALNLMILERDPNGKQMETVEEARAFLSQDFGK